MLAVLEGLKREIDSVKAIRSTEVGVTCDVLELDEHAEELQNVFFYASAGCVSTQSCCKCRDKLRAIS